MTLPGADKSPRDTAKEESASEPRSYASMFRESRIRLIFWVAGSLCGAILTYTTRHYVNGDAIAYFDMAEAFRLGVWSDLVNLTYAPGYSILLGMARCIFPHAPELFVAKALNFFCFLAAMAACDLFVSRVLAVVGTDSWQFAVERARIGGLSSCKKGASEPPARNSNGRASCRFSDGETTTSADTGSSWGGVRGDPSCKKGLPVSSQLGSLLSAVCYSAFLLAALVWVKIQVVAPDLAVFSFVLLCSMVVLKIRSGGASFFDFGLLGLFCGLGYIFKTFFFPFSAVFFLLAALCCGSVKRALPRLMVGIAVMVVVAAPLVIAQSMRVGRVSFGESGNYNYAQFVAGRGERIHKPRVIHEKPEVLGYEQGSITSYPRGNDPAYWGLGIKPALNIHAQVSALWENLKHLTGRMFLPLAAVLLWFCVQWRRYGLSPIHLVPPSPAVILLAVSLAGTLMYCLVVMEIRYVGAFVFLGIVGLALLPRYSFAATSSGFRVDIETGLLVVFLMGTVAHSMVDQTIRDSYTLEGKTSHRELLEQAESVSAFLNSRGLKTGDTVAIVRPFHDRLTWARRAGVRVTAEFTNADEFFKAGLTERRATLDAVKSSGLKAVVANHPSFGHLVSEGWLKVPGTTGYYVLLL